MFKLQWFSTEEILEKSGFDYKMYEAILIGKIPFQHDPNEDVKLAAYNYLKEQADDIIDQGIGKTKPEFWTVSQMGKLNLLLTASSFPSVFTPVHMLMIEDDVFHFPLGELYKSLRIGAPELKTLELHGKHRYCVLAEAFYRYQFMDDEKFYDSWAEKKSIVEFIIYNSISSRFLELKRQGIICNSENDHSQDCPHDTTIGFIGISALFGMFSQKPPSPDLPKRINWYVKLYRSQRWESNRQDGYLDMEDYSRFVELIKEMKQEYAFHIFHEGCSYKTFLSQCAREKIGIAPGHVSWNTRLGKLTAYNKAMQEISNIACADCALSEIRVARNRNSINLPRQMWDEIKKYI